MKALAHLATEDAVAAHNARVQAGRIRGNPAASDEAMAAYRRQAQEWTGASASRTVSNAPVIEAGQRWLAKAPLETVEQAAFVRWAKEHESQWPELALLFAVPNAGKRSKATRGRMLAEGLKAGVPDLCLPVSKRGYHGLFIEMKRVNASPSDTQDSQAAWHNQLAEYGNYVCVCKGAEAAKLVVRWYMGELESVQGCENIPPS